MEQRIKNVDDGPERRTPFISIKSDAFCTVAHIVI